MKLKITFDKHMESLYKPMRYLSRNSFFFVKGDIFFLDLVENI